MSVNHLTGDVSLESQSHRALPEVPRHLEGR